jgi:hypothetical protein
LKRKRYSPYLYSDLLEDPAILKGPTSSSSLTAKTAASNNKKQTFICPMDYCRKSFHYRSVRDRHVENVHGFHASQTKKLPPSATLNEAGELSQPHLSQGITTPEEVGPEKFMWSELLGVAV